MKTITPLCDNYLFELVVRIWSCRYQEGHPLGVGPCPLMYGDGLHQRSRQSVVPVVVLRSKRDHTRERGVSEKVVPVDPFVHRAKTLGSFSDG